MEPIARRFEKIGRTWFIQRFATSGAIWFLASAFVLSVAVARTIK